MTDNTPIPFREGGARLCYISQKKSLKRPAARTLQDNIAPATWCTDIGKVLSNATMQAPPPPKEEKFQDAQQRHRGTDASSKRQRAPES